MITIRTMQMKDTEAVSALEREIFSMPWSKNGFEESLNSGHAIFFVAEEQNRIIGYCGMIVSIDEGEITNVAVAQTERCRGVGAMLIKAAKAEAEKRSIGRLVLEVRVSNESAIRLYERNGFRNCGVRPNFYEKPKEDAYIMIYGQ